MNAQTRNFTDACHENSISELRDALLINDSTDCKTWNITELERTTAIETAINELSVIL